MKNLAACRVAASAVGLLAVLLIQPSTIAAATPLVMAFDGVPDSDPNLLTDDYFEDGIKMSLDYNHYDIVGEKVQIDTYPIYSPGEVNGAIRFELANGGLFYLKSLEVTFLPIVLGGMTNFAEHVFQFSTGDPIVPAPVDGSVVLEDEFADLPALTYFTYAIIQPDIPGTEFTQFNTRLDNITLIPEPTTFTLLGLGSLALVMVRRPRSVLH